MTMANLYWRIWIGLGALVLWVLLFSGGLHIETYDYRRVLAPITFETNEKTAEASLKSPIAVHHITPPPNVVVAFLVATLFYTPTNLAVLALLAAVWADVRAIL
jgi:hypothetical protein